MRLRAVTLIIFSFILVHSSCHHTAWGAINRAIIFSYLITNPTNKPVKCTYFYTYLPVKQTSWQEVVKVEHTCSNGTVLEDGLGNAVLKCAIPLVAPYSNIQVDVRAWVLLKERPEKMGKLRHRERFLSPQKYIESESPEIRGLASRLKSRSDYITSRRVFNWVKNNIHFKAFISRPMGALKALRERTGDCTEGMALFVALERALGISSVGLAGYLVTKNGRINPLSYHNWALFFADGAFRIADPKEATFDSKYNQYIATTFLGKRKEGARFPLGLYERFKVSSKALRVKQL